MTISEWYIPVLEDFVVQRAVLTLKLNKAIRYYRELIVPGIGGVRFGRQLSWTVAAIKIAPEFTKYSPVKIANAIEALAGKLAYRKDPENTNLRGIRAYKRYEDEVSFEKLSQPKYYVTIPYRMATVRALYGLGLADQARFNSMQLTPAGNDLAEFFLEQDKGGRGHKNIRNALRDWINGERDIRQVDGLWKDGITSEEKTLIKKRLLAEVDSKKSDPKRRFNLLNIYKKEYLKDDFKIDRIINKLSGSQREEIELAVAFDDMLSIARKFIHECAELVEKSGPIETDELAKKVPGKIETLIKSAEYFLKLAESLLIAHPESMGFAADLIRLTNKNYEILKYIVARDGAILTNEQGNVINKGPLFFRRREILEPDETESEENIIAEMTSTREKIQQLYQLWSDCL